MGQSLVLAYRRRDFSRVPQVSIWHQYLDYLHRTGLAEYRKTPGNRGVLGLCRIVKDRAEFLLISLWDSTEAIREFAGDNIEKAVFYSKDERFLVECDDHVTQYEVVFDTALTHQD